MNTAVFSSAARRGRLLWAVVGAVLVTALAVAPGASARLVYVASFGTDTVSVIDTQTNRPLQPIVFPSGLEVGPYALAITPDGKRLYVTSDKLARVFVFDTATGAILAEPSVGEFPEGIAITPDGARAYVGNLGSESVSVIDTRTNTVIGSIKVGKEPQDVAISPDGRRAYVTNTGSGEISVIDTATNTVIAHPESKPKPWGLAVTPDGGRVYVANTASETASVLDPLTNVVGAPIPVGKDPLGVAVSPDGTRAYFAAQEGGALSVIDTRTNGRVAEIGGLKSPAQLAITPDGRFAYVSSFANGTISVVDLQANRLLGESIPVGDGATHVAIVPDQPPRASVSVRGRMRPGVPVAFSAAASSDPDGSIATYAWQFGDGKTATVGPPKTSHAYRSPGTRKVTLTLTDNEGCSTLFVFTGQTASCNGSGVATVTKTVKVAYPGVRVRCPRSAGTGGCVFKLQVLAKNPKKGAKPKVETAVAKTRVKAGRSAIVSLKAKKAFRTRLARAKSVLVRETETIGRSRIVSLRRLKIVQ